VARVSRGVRAGWCRCTREPSGRVVVSMPCSSISYFISEPYLFGSHLRFVQVGHVEPKAAMARMNAAPSNGVRGGQTK
jgi:hypothetical protein